MTCILINYRRADSADSAAKIYKVLSSIFAASNVLIDIDNLAKNERFAQSVENIVVSCDIELVIIGKRWLTVADASGARRLEYPEDIVRLQLEIALKQNIPILPILVDGASFPDPDELPLSLRPLCYHNGLVIRNDDWESDIKRLTDFLERITPKRSMADVRLSTTNPESVANKSEVFISYSHRDARWLQRLQVHIKPLEQLGTIVRWDDTLIAPGTKWKEEISKALESAKVAVLLISADFLASDFITTNELPHLLAAAKDKGTLILPVIVSPCRYQQTESLSKFQSINSPTQPLSALSKSRQEAILVKVSEAIENAVRDSS